MQARTRFEGCTSRPQSRYARQIRVAWPCPPLRAVRGFCTSVRSAETQIPPLPCVASVVSGMVARPSDADAVPCGARRLAVLRVDRPVPHLGRPRRRISVATEFVDARPTVGAYALQDGAGAPRFRRPPGCRDGTFLFRGTLRGMGVLQLRSRASAFGSGLFVVVDPVQS